MSVQTAGPAAQTTEPFISDKEMNPMTSNIVDAHTEHRQTGATPDVPDLS